MKRLFISTVTSLVLISSLTPSVAWMQSDAKVVGSWDMTTETPQGNRPGLLTIKQEGDKLSGSIKGARGERALDSITVKGNEITFRMTIQFQGQDMVITYKGKVEKGEMKGDADFGGLATGTWSAVPHKETASTPPSATPAPTGPATAGTGAINISGSWSFTVETSVGTGTPTMTFKQDGEKLSGNYTGQLGESAFTGTLKNGDINFSFKVNAQGQELEVTYTGRVESNVSMKGKVKLGDLGEGTWTAKRQQ